MSAPYVRDAIHHALSEGYTIKIRALDHAYLSLRRANHWTSREVLYATWRLMERDGTIVREGEEYRAKLEVQNDDK